MVVTQRAARAVSATALLAGSVVLGTGAAAAVPSAAMTPSALPGASARPDASALSDASALRGASALPDASALPEPFAGIAPEADVSHHGHVLLWGAGLKVRMRTENHGPSSLTGVTVRVRISVALAGRQELPQSCLRADRRTVLCRTGSLRADGVQERRLALELRLAGRPDEVVVRVDTLWNGGATDRNPRNNDHKVLAPATGDEYVF
ncbi:hypothetical protein OG887_17770 [Streptomyces sp. NBC_00053]|uniref:hypothetical protein n=1 Tax=unclassified Streptomyces TaxID=2593676 RepID=UPI000F5BDEF4|nr:MULTISPECIES: hypothetical protein [unclassified Streptomyces]MCX4395940.1 hypothetical protein [Streptomyces sp. NBC_01767]MCX5101428.1 hypothetical protein [Streptomyces sp. NBC_00439]MCX5160953.1 hypothetical protein [Streptomyces sp. NBC_00305]MCX5219476.1 hypothetical protein [Streptomyces sp. NBC_00264]MCX5501215.1 hypothetical protein [Streptomyces sp. NBC_00052]